MNERTAWGVCDKDSYIDPLDLRHTKQEAILCCEDNEKYQQSRSPFRVVPVKIVILEDKT